MIFPRSNRRARRRRRGAVAVELTFSIVFVVLPMLCGIWEIGCLLDAQQSLQEAVREGGRQAATGQMTNSQVAQVVLQYLINSNVSISNVSVTVVNSGSGADSSQANMLDPLTVSATLPFANVDWSTTQQFVSDKAVLSASSLWYSAKDAPYAAPPAAPVQ